MFQLLYAIETVGLIYIRHMLQPSRKVCGALVQWLKLAAWTVAVRGFESRSGIQVSVK